MATSTTSAKFKCDECGLRYSYTQSLNKHKRVSHGEVSSEMCEICGKDYALSWIKYHVRTCKGPKPHRQRVKSSSNSSSLKYECGECGHKYAHSQSLNKHIRLYHGENSTQICETCGKEFSLSYIKSHVITCKGRRVLATCEKCGEKFSKMLQLLQHKKTCHGDGEVSESIAGLLPTTDSPHGELHSDAIKTQGLQIDSSVEDDDSDDWNAQPSFTKAGNNSSNIASEMHELQKSVGNTEAIAHELQLTEQSLESSRSEELLRIDSMHLVHPTVSQLDEGNGDSYVVIKTEPNPFLAESNPENSNLYIITEEMNPTLLQLDQGNSNTYFVTKTEILEEDYTFSEKNDNLNSESYVEPMRKFSDDIQSETQVDVIKAEELHIESTLPPIEDVSEAETNQGTTSTSISTELSLDNCALSNVIKSHSTVKRPSSALSKAYSIHEGSTQMCEQCGNEYSLCAIKKHTRLCKGPKSCSVSCSECGKKFPRTASLLIHRQVSHGITEAPSPATAKCDECGQSFTQTSSLRRHIRIAHKGSTWSRGSEAAGEQVDDITTKGVHIQSAPVEENVSDLNAPSESTEQPNSADSKVYCGKCGQSFAFVHTLKRHVRLFHEGSTQTCEQCGNEYSICAIQRHSLSCSGPTLFPVSCDECDMKFSRTASLLTHWQSKHGIMEAPRLRVPNRRPADSKYRCDECGRSFIRRDSLRTHIKVAHEGCTQTCELCGNEFTLWGIRKHRPLCEGPTSFSAPCDRCGKKFPKTARLLAHQLICYQTAQKITSDLIVAEQQADAPVAKHISDLDAPSASTETGQGITSSNIATELSRNDRAPDVTDSNSSLERPSRANPELRCEECGQYFTIAKCLIKHINLMHKDSTRACEKCGNEYTLSTIRIHRQTCEGATFPVACHECGKKFSGTASLFTHQEVCHEVGPELASDLQAAELIAIKNEELNIQQSLLPPVEGYVPASYAPTASTGTTSSSIVTKQSQDDCEHQEIHHGM